MNIQIRNTSALNLLSKISDKSLDVVFTSPPYNIGSKADRKDGYRKEGKFDPKSYGGIQGYADNLPENEYQKLQIDTLTLAAKKLKDDGVLIYNHKPRRRKGIMVHPIVWLSKVEGLTLMEEIIWDRGSTHNHSDKLFWPHTERLYVFRRTDGTYRLKNNENLKFRSDIWRIPLTTKPAIGHAAPFPTPLAEAVLQAFAHPGDLVCDPYSGSGTTAVASVWRGCNFIGSEMDKEYHKASVRRVAEAMNMSNVIQFKMKVA
jgi:site-specific DNA-methyltransferase (adenine-specific)